MAACGQANAGDDVERRAPCSRHGPRFIAKDFERWHGHATSLDDARRLLQGYVQRYNNVRLNSAVGPFGMDLLPGPELEAARKQPQIHRLQAA